MATNIQVKSFGYITFGPPDSNAYMMLPESPLARNSAFVEAKPFGKHPIIVNTQPLGQLVAIHIDLLTDPFDSLVADQDIIMRFFAPGMQGTLVVQFDTVERQVEAWVQKAIPHSGSSNRFTAILRIPDPRWRSVQQQTDSATFPEKVGAIIDDDTRETADEGDGLDLDGSQGIYRGATNLVTNSSFETDTTGWIAAGPTISRSTDVSKFGDASLKAVMDGASTAVAGIVVSTAVSLNRFSGSVWVYLAGGWDGGDVVILFSAMSGSSDQSIPADGTIVNKWQKVSRRWLPDGVDPAGFLAVTASGIPSAGRVIYIDGAQFEENDWPTPHILTDGGTAARAAASMKVTDLKLDETQGAIAIKIRFNWQDGAADNDRYLFTWAVDANNRIQLWFDAAAIKMKLERFSGGSGSTVELGGMEPGIFATTTIVAAWTATQLKIARDSGPFGTTANTDIPDLSSADIFVGDDGAGGDAMDSDLFWFSAYAGTLDNDDVDALSVNPDAPTNRVRSTRDLTRRVWKAAGSGTSVTRTGSAQNVVNTLTLGPRGGLSQLAEEAFVADDVWKFSVTLRSDVVSTWTLRVGDELTSESTDVDVRIGPVPTRHSVSHTFTGADTGILMSIVNSTGGTKTGDVSDPVLEASSAGGGDLTVSPGPPMIANPPGGLFSPPGGVQDAGDFRWHIPGPKGPDDTIEIVAHNDGNADDDQAVITVTPTKNKSSADWWTRAAERIIQNRSTAPLNNYTVDVTAGGINHASLVAAVQSLASGDDFRVLVDGVEVPRWEGGGGWNSATLKVWINMDLAPGKIGNLITAMPASSSVGDLMHFAPGEATVFDDAGFVAVGAECVEYEGKTSDGLLIKTRGTRNTAAATHAIGVSAYWVEKRVQLIYDYDNAPAPDSFAELEPLIDKVNSTNTSLVWTQFRDFDKPSRSMPWTLRSDERDKKLLFMGSAEDVGGDETKLEATFSHDPPNSSLRPGNLFERNFPVPYKIVSFTLALDQDIILDMLGVDDKGVERLWFTFDSADNGVKTSNDLTVAPPTGIGSALSTAGFRFRSWMIARSPVSGVTDAAAKNNEDITSGTFAVPIIVPERIDQESQIIRVEVQLSVTNQPQSESVYLAVQDADGVLHQISNTHTVSVDSATAKLFNFNIGTNAEVGEGDTIYLVVEEVQGETLTWYGWNLPYLDQQTVQHFRLYSEDLHPNEAALADDDSAGNISALTVTLLPNLEPGIIVTGAEERYFINAVIASVATGQEVAINTILSASTDTIVEIDMKNRTVLEKDSGGNVLENLLPAVTFSDPDDWILLPPLNNTFTYSEPGIDDASVSFVVTWHHVWS